MLTSKEIIERTGISRATLNNYIASGLIARPKVLPPGPEHGAAPRIGYFPDETIERIQTIQRLKREGWSITRIAEHFSGHGGGAHSAPVAANPAPPPTPTQTQAAPVPPAASPGPAEPVRSPMTERLTLTPADADQPAYLLDPSFGLAWTNTAAQTSALSPLANRRSAGNIFRHLLAMNPAHGRDVLVRFHLETARALGVAAAQLFAGLEAEASTALEAQYREIVRPAVLPVVAHSLLPAAGGLPARSVHAVRFQQGVLVAIGEAVAPAPVEAVTGPAVIAAPALSSVAVLVAVLQDAADLWVRLSAEEYFELLNEVGVELDAIFRNQQGRPARQAGEAVVCYFLPQPQPQGSYRWNALAAAHRAREAIRGVSQRWRVRKGWEVELRINIGVDEGEDWLGTLGLPGQADVRVLGDAADHADQLSRHGRAGAILLTRNLVGKLSRDERQQLTYGVPRLEGTHGEAPLLFTFARLADLAGPGAVPPAVADLAVAELLALHAPVSASGGSPR